MNETFDMIEDIANFTSAGTSHLTLNTSRGLEEVEIENITQLDSDYKTSDLGQLYTDFPDHFIKIQKITFRNQTFFNCYFTTEEKVSILKFDSEGELLGEKHL